MTSIPVDSIDLYMAKSDKPQWLSVTNLLLTVIGSLLLLFWNDQSDKFKNVDTSISSIRVTQSSQGESLARLEERTKSLERVVYETKATSLGFKKPEIVRTGLGVNTKFESRTSALNGEYFIKYTILSYDPAKSILQLRLDAQLPGLVFRNNTFVINVQPGEVVELTKYIGVKNVRKIYLQVLDVPVHDQAILAIGHKQDESGAPS
jgi:hypothetical protein